MKIFTVLTNTTIYDGGDPSQEYDVNSFKSDEERLKWLCSEWFEYISWHIIDQIDDDENEIKKLHKDKLLSIKVNEECEILSIKINQNYVSHETLNTLLETYGRGYCDYHKFHYELYDAEI